VSSRREPLLWLQLLAIGAIPLELLLLRLVLAGSDLGPVPGLERVLCWGIAAFAPGLLLWRQPADWGSLLLVRLPLEGRTPEQRLLSSLQDHGLVRVGSTVGVLALLPLFWWLDRDALLVETLSPLHGSARLTCLLIALPLLALLVWHWHQLIQSLWLLSRSAASFASIAPLDTAALKDLRLSPGLSVLRLPALDWDSVVAGAVEPEQSGEEKKSPELDAEISERNVIPTAETQGHDSAPQTSGPEESEPEEPTEPPPGSA
jgi:hypothetical protein